jgi:hypothetical protein
MARCHVTVCSWRKKLKAHGKDKRVLLLLLLLMTTPSKSQRGGGSGTDVLKQRRDSSRQGRHVLHDGWSANCNSASSKLSSRAAGAA